MKGAPIAIMCPQAAKQKKKKVRPWEVPWQTLCG